MNWNPDTLAYKYHYYGMYILLCNSGQIQPNKRSDATFRYFCRTTMRPRILRDPIKKKDKSRRVNRARQIIINKKKK